MFLFHLLQGLPSERCLRGLPTKILYTVHVSPILHSCAVVAAALPIKVGDCMNGGFYCYVSQICALHNSCLQTFSESRCSQRIKIVSFRKYLGSRGCLLTCIPEVTGSNLGWDFACSDECILLLSMDAVSGTFRDKPRNNPRPLPFRSCSVNYLLMAIPFDAMYSYVEQLTASLQ
jgi:hypothetical protein